jgi:hypothetical protein
LRRTRARRPRTVRDHRCCVTEHRLCRTTTTPGRTRLRGRHRSTARSACGSVHQHCRAAIRARPRWSRHQVSPVLSSSDGNPRVKVKATKRARFGVGDRRRLRSSTAIFSGGSTSQSRPGMRYQVSGGATAPSSRCRPRRRS